MASSDDQPEPEQERASAIEPAHAGSPDFVSEAASAVEKVTVGKDAPSDVTEKVSQTEEAVSIDVRFAAELRARLEQIWEVTGARRTSSQADLEHFVGVVTHVFDASDFFSEGELGIREESQGIEGDADSVRLVATAALQQLEGSPAELREFVGGELAATVERLEVEGLATPEEIVDIVTPAIVALPAVPAKTNLSLQLLGYLEKQSRKDSGYFATVTGVGHILAPLSETETKIASIVAYHIAMRGVWLMDRGDEGATFDSMARKAVSAAASNTAAGIAHMQPESAGGLSDDAREVLVKLKTISAATADSLETRVDASQILAALKLESLGSTEAARDVLTVVFDMGSVPSTWSSDAYPAVDRSRLEAVSAVAAVAGAVDRQAAARFFNAGVSLGRAQTMDDDTMLARLQLNAIGLSWALREARGDLLVALSTDDGIDCVVNLAAVASDLGEDKLRAFPLTRKLVQDVLSLTDSTVLRAVDDLRVDLARLQASRQRLEFEIDYVANGDELLESVSAAIGESYSHSAQLPSSSPELDTARVVSEIFDRLDGHRRWSLANTVSMLVDARRQPAAAFESNYRQFADPIDDVVGTGPLVPAGVLAAEEWRQRCEMLMQRQESIVPGLRAFAATI